MNNLYLKTQQKNSTMKKAYFFIILSLVVAFAQAQFKWGNRGGLWAYDYGYAVVTDNSGNVYVAGKFEFNAIFSNQITVNCAGNHDAYIAKYDPNGAIQWVKTFGGPNGDYAWSMSTDGSFLYVSGEVEGPGSTINFQNSNVTLTTKGDNDVLVAKFDMDGNLIWAKNEGAAKSEKAVGVTYDNQGNIYITGYFTDDTNFNGTNIAGAGGHDIFVAKYDGTGAFQWVKTAGGAGRDEGKGIKADNNGNVYVCGMFQNSATFGSISMTAYDQYQDAFVAKLSATDGSILWVKKGDSAYDDVAHSLTMDNAGYVYATGEYNAFITFQDPPKGVPTTGATNVFVVKLDGSGNVSWISGGGGPVTDRARGIGTDGTNIYITGQFGLNATFGAHSASAADSSDIFLASVDPNTGGFNWVAEADGPPDTFEPLGYESGIAITGKNGNVYATGAMLRDTSVSGAVSADFGGVILTGYQRTDMYIVAIANTGVGLTENPLASEKITIYPNPGNGQFYFDLSKVKSTVELNIYSSTGQLISTGRHTPGQTLSVDLTVQSEGIYFAEVKTEGAAPVRKKLILKN
jgi:hypothetical protein